MAEAEDDLPFAMPISPGSREARPEQAHRATPVRPPKSMPSIPDTKPPKPRALAACAVIGCFGLAVLGTLAVVTTTAIMLVDHIGKEIAERTKDSAEDEFKHARYVGSVQPTKLSTDTAKLPIPGTVMSVAHGGNGRFLLIQTPNEILIFDPNLGRFLPALPIPSPVYRCTAGSSKVFVHRQGKLERYGLLSRALELSEPWPESVYQLLIGAGSEGPLYVMSPRGTGTEVTMIDTQTLKPLAGSQRLRLSDFHPHDSHASFDGRCLGLGANRGFVPFAPVLRYESNRTLSYVKLQMPQSSGHLSPSPNGEFIYSSYGVFLATGEQALPPPRDHRYFYTFPTAQGDDFFLRLESETEIKTRQVINISLAGHQDRRPQVDSFAKIAGAEEVAGLSQEDFKTPLSAVDRVHFWPAAGLLAVIPPPLPDGSQPPLRLSRVDVKKLLDESDHKPDYPIILSDPPQAATKGEVLRYPLEAWSLTGQVDFLVKNPPEGMKLIRQPDERIVLEWMVPEHLALDEVEIVIRAIEPARQYTDQRFHVRLWDPLP